jgi:hypothetical protein
VKGDRKMGFYQQAADKLKKEFGGVSGQKEKGAGS